MFLLFIYSLWLESLCDPPKLLFNSTSYHVAINCGDIPPNRGSTEQPRHLFRHIEIPPTTAPPLEGQSRRLVVPFGPLFRLYQDRGNPSLVCFQNGDLIEHLFCVGTSKHLSKRYGFAKTYFRHQRGVSRPYGRMRNWTEVARISSMDRFDQWSFRRKMACMQSADEFKLSSNK